AAGSSSSLSAIEGPFQLQEYLSILISRDPHDVERIVALPHESDLDPSQPGTSIKGKERSCSDASGSISMDEDNVVQSVDTDIWVYEQLRRVVLDLSTPWLTSLQEDCDKNAKPDTCSAMNAGDWMYLCASHGEEKQCCAIDYTIHTLDGTTSLLNSARHFPSRTYVPNTSLRHFGSMARRLSRIFVHAWCYHRDVFQACEAETSLYTRFFALLERYDLLATDNL
ncbi:Mob1/phocein, partial [Violaceomyces palustris]